jgi:subtilisin family serine protease
MKVKLIIISIVLLLVMVFACGCIPVMEKLGLVNPVNEEQLTPEKGGPPDGLVKILIGFKEKPGPPEQALVKGLGGKIKYTYNIIPAIAASVPEVAIEALKKNPNITNVELDSKVYALDTELDNSWGVKRIGAGNVHTSNKGTDIKVAIIDTGIDYTHPDLDANYVDGYDFVNGDDDPMDDHGHGTHVAGIIAAEDNGFGVVGVAPEAKLYALKVLDSDGSGYVSEVIFAIQWASDPDGDGSASDRLDIINMSLGADKGNIFLKWACNLAYDDGLLIVAAAGNDYGGAVDYPAAYDSVIAVSATGSNDELAWFSSTGKQVELAAPGVSIKSTLLGEGYGEKSGTSMASPHVAGVVALVWAVNTGWENDDVRVRLRDTADDLGTTGWDSEFGYGLVNAAEAAGVETPPPGTGTIAGNVIDASTGLAIAGAKVAVDGTDLFANTDASGMYTITDVAVGDHTVTASATGYIEESKTAYVSEGEPTVVDFALALASTPSNTMHVSDIKMSLKKAGTNVNAIATVTIIDASGNPVRGATVLGTWSDATSDTDSGITKTSGQVSFKSDRIKNPPSGTTFIFTVDDVVKAGWIYDPFANEETSDSIKVP